MLLNGKEFKIIVKNKSDKNLYIQSAKLIEEKLNQAWFRHSDIKNRTVLELKMSRKPSGLGQEIVLPSMSNHLLQMRLSDSYN